MTGAGAATTWGASGTRTVSLAVSLAVSLGVSLAVSWERGEASGVLPRRRSIAARARSLASGVTAVSAGETVIGLATTGSVGGAETVGGAVLALAFSRGVG